MKIFRSWFLLSFFILVPGDQEKMISLSCDDGLFFHDRINVPVVTETQSDVLIKRYKVIEDV